MNNSGNNYLASFSLENKTVLNGIVTITPSLPTRTEQIHIHLDASGTSLESATKVYLHSGVATDAPSSTSFNKTVGNWGLDDSVGEILKFLDDNELTEDTIVIYTSDQGFFLGEHGWFDKRFIYDESFQMPFLIRYPTGIKAGEVNDDICCNVDFEPPFLDYAGVTTPSYMQGESLRPLFESRTPQEWPQIAYHRYWMHKDPDHNAYAHYGIRNKRYKLIYWYNEGFELPGTNEGGEDKEWELFDCLDDPMELFNLYQDPKYSSVVKEMTQLLNYKMLSIGDRIEH